MNSCRTRRALLAVVACTGVTVAAAGCGSSSNSATTSSASTAAPGSSSSASAAAPTGAPLKVLVTSFVNSPIGSVPQVYAGAEVAAENINKAGGIAGRPIHVVECNGKADPRAELACAREAVSQGAVATVSDVFVANAGGALEILNRAHIAELADPAAAPLQYTLPNTFPIEYLAGRSNGCLSPAALQSADGGKIGVIVGQDPIAQGVLNKVEATLNANPSVKSKFVGSVSVPDTTQDFLPFVQKLSDKGASYIVVVLAPGLAPGLVTAAADAGKKWVFCVDGGQLSPQLLAKLAPLVKEFVLSQTYPPSALGQTIPLVKEYVEQMNAAYKAGNKNADLTLDYVNTARAWFGMQAFAQIAKSIKGDITAESFLTAASNATVDLGYAKADFASPQGQPPYKRIFQPEGFVGAWDASAKDVKPLGQVNLLALEQGKG